MDIHVIGAGIAGTLLARALRRRGAPVVLHDDPAHPSASRAAAGIVNPVTGIRFSPAWNWDVFFPVAVEAFRQMEAELGRRVWHPLPIDRVFRDEGERERWEKRAADGSCAGWVRTLASGPWRAPHGGIRLEGGGWFDYCALPGLARGIPRADGEPPPGAVVVECRGFPAGEHWDALPWNPAKGEILTVHLAEWPEDRITMSGIFLVPMGGGVFRLGAGYSWDDLEPRPTEAGREALIRRAGHLGAEVVEVLEHRAGIRPILRGSRPVIGPHPGKPNHWIFNGLGSKGALWAPALAEELAEWILGGACRTPEADAGRFFP